MPAATIATTTLLLPSETVTYLRQKHRLQVDEDEVRRWVRHGRVAGEVDDHGRVVVDVAAVDMMLTVRRMEGYGSAEPMVDYIGLLRRS